MCGTPDQITASGCCRQIVCYWSFRVMPEGLECGASRAWTGASEPHRECVPHMSLVCHWHGVLRKLRCPPWKAVCRLVFSLLSCVGCWLLSAEVSLRRCLTWKLPLLCCEIKEDPVQCGSKRRLWESQINSLLSFLAKAAWLLSRRCLQGTVGPCARVV